MCELYDAFMFFSGHKTKILKSVSPQVKKDILKAYDELLKFKVWDESRLKKYLDELLERGDRLKIKTCSDYYGIEGACRILCDCKHCMRYTRAVIVRYIKQPGNEKYLPLIKRRKKDDDVK